MIIYLMWFFYCTMSLVIGGIYMLLPTNKTYEIRFLFRLEHVLDVEKYFYLLMLYAFISMFYLGNDSSWHMYLYFIYNMFARYLTMVSCSTENYSIKKKFRMEILLLYKQFQHETYTSFGFCDAQAKSSKLWSISYHNWLHQILYSCFKVSVTSCFLYTSCIWLSSI